MNDKPETVADVLAEMRSQNLLSTHDWTDRIERAMAASAVPNDWRKRIVSLERGFEFDEILRVHTPTVTLRFSSIDSRYPNPYAQGWKDRDAVADLIAHAPPAVPVESLGRDAGGSSGCVHHDFSILDSYIRNLRWSHDTPNEVRDAVASNLRGLYTHLMTRGLFAGSGSWDAGRLAAAKWVEKRRCAFADEYGLVDHSTGVLEFGNGFPERDEYYCELSEIEEAIRALPAPKFVVHTVPDELTAVYMLGKIDGRRERNPLDEPAEPVASVPDGWQLVPVTPRLGMLDALSCAMFGDARLTFGDRREQFRRGYAAMLAESPQPPTNQEGAAP